MQNAHWLNTDGIDLSLSDLEMLSVIIDFMVGPIILFDCIWTRKLHLHKYKSTQVCKRTKIHKEANTQVHKNKKYKYTLTHLKQGHRYTSVHIHKYTSIQLYKHTSICNINIGMTQFEIECRSGRHSVTKKFLTILRALVAKPKK